MPRSSLFVTPEPSLEPADELPSGPIRDLTFSVGDVTMPDLGSFTSLGSHPFWESQDAIIGYPEPKKDESDNEEDSETGGVADREYGTPMTRKKESSPSKARAASPRPVSADNWDEIDQCLVRMKQAKVREKDIRVHIREEFGIDWNLKTIGNRYARLMKKVRAKAKAEASNLAEVLAAAQGDPLVNDPVNWHAGDDDALQQAIIAGNAKVEDTIREFEAQIAETRANAWNTIAESLKTINPVTNYSAKACHKRSDALNAGTAAPPLESIPFPPHDVALRIQQRREKEAELARFARLAEGSSRAREGPRPSDIIIQDDALVDPALLANSGAPPAATADIYSGAPGGLPTFEYKKSNMGSNSWISNAREY